MELRNNFLRSRMNKDFDERLVPAGEYTDALNVRTGISETGDEGVINNVKGNTVLTDLKYNGTSLNASAKCIGALDDPYRDTIYWFISSPDDNVDMIVSMNVISGNVIYHVVSTTVLNFNNKYLITGVDLIEDLLFWTDGLNPPRKINVKSSYLNVVAKDLNVIVHPPLEAPTVALFETSNEENYLEDRFLSFSYRYKYKDGEHSALSQFSDIAFSPGVFKLNYSTFGNEGMRNRFNAAKITFKTGDSNVVGVDVCFKDSGSNIVNVIKRFDKEEEGWSDDSDESITFNNKNVYTVLKSSDLLRLYDNVPRKAKAQTVLGNRVMYGNYTDGYNLVTSTKAPLVLDYDVEVVSEEIGVSDIVLAESAGDAYTIDTSTVVSESTLDIDLSNANLINGAILSIEFNHEHDSFSGDAGYTQSSIGFDGAVVFNLQRDYLNAYDLATSQEFIDAVSTHVLFANCADGYSLTDRFNCEIVAQSGWTKVGSGITSDTGEFKITSTPTSSIISIQVPAMKFEDNANPGTYAYEYFKSVASDVVFVETGSRESLHSNRGYEVAVVYMDEYNRSSTALVDRDNTAFVHVGDSTAKNHLKVTLKNSPPEWATRYKFVVKPNHHEYSTVYSNVYYNEERTNSVWFKINGTAQNTIKEGDTLIVKSDSGGPIGSLVKTKVLSTKVHEEDFISNNTNEQGDDIIEVQGFYIELKPSGFSAEAIENAHLNFGETVRPSQVYPALRYDCHIDNPAGPLPYIPYDLPAGSEVRFTFSEKRRRHSARAGSRHYKFDKTFTASRDYDNLHDMVIGESIDFTSPSSLTGGDDEVLDGSYHLEFLPALGSSIQVIPRVDSKIQIQFQEDTATGKLVMVFRGGTDGKYNLFGRYSNSVLRCEIDVTRSSGLAVFETEAVEADNEIYYEGSKNYEITGGYHKGSSQDQTASLPAIIDLSFFDCFAFGNGVESRKIEDFIAGKEFYLGSRVTSVSKEEYKEADRFADITYSGVYNEESNLNNLNEFNLALVNYKSLDKYAGRIEKMIGRKTDIIVLQGNRISTVLQGKNLLSDAGAGGAIVATPAVLGTQISRTEEYGVGSNPESVAVFGSDIYGTDAKRGVVWALKGEQFSIISELGMNSHFSNMFRESSSVQLLGGYDPFNHEYVLSNNGEELPSTTGLSPCGISVSKESSNTQEVINVDMGARTGDVVFSHEIYSGQINITAEHDGVEMLNSNVSSTGTVSFKKNTQYPKDIKVTITPTNSSYKVTTACITPDVVTIVRVVLTDAKSTPLTNHVQHDWSLAGYTSPQREDHVIFEVDGVSLHNSSTGNESEGFYPEENGVIRMVSNKKVGDDFVYSLANNKLQHLLSDTLYDESTVGTLIPLLNTIATVDNTSTGVYEGSFTYNNTTDKAYLYLVWDYRTAAGIDLCYDAADINEACCVCLSSQTYYIDAATFTGATSVYTDTNLTIKAADGFYSVLGSYRQQNNGLLLNLITCPSCASSSYNSSVVDAVAAVACGLAVDQTYYHNGSGSLPGPNDNVYSDLANTTPLGAGFYKLSANVTIEVTGSLGLVAAKGTCITCYNYTVTNDGGSGELLFTYVDCGGTPTNHVLAVGAHLDFCAQSVAPLPSGLTLTGGTVTC